MFAMEVVVLWKADKVELYLSPGNSCDARVVVAGDKDDGWYLMASVRTNWATEMSDAS